jgi:hypothetical protein
MRAIPMKVYSLARYTYEGVQPCALYLWWCTAMRAIPMKVYSKASGDISKGLRAIPARICMRAHKSTSQTLNPKNDGVTRAARRLGGWT